VHVVIVTGLSGSGKSTAIRVLEDLGFYCIDNLPVVLTPRFIDLCENSEEEITRVALGIDLRERAFFADYPAVIDEIRRAGHHVEILYLDAGDDVLMRRFSETRRPHPLAQGRSASEGIRDERSRLNVIRGMADEIVDTSDMTVHELRQFFMGLTRGRSRSGLVITLLSFGYKYGVPVDADLMFDVRCLPNPHFVPTLRARTGRDRAVARFMEKDAPTREFMDRLEEYVRFVVPHYVAEGKSYLTIAIGCTGGRHRSVMIAERLRRALADLAGARARVRHRDIAHV